MDLKEFKKAIIFAKKHGLKSLKIDGAFEAHFSEVLQALPQVRRTLKSISDHREQTKNIPVPDPGPTLEQINDFIYNDKDRSA